MSLLDKGKSVQGRLKGGRYAWLQVASGSVKLCGISMDAGDGASVYDEPTFEILANTSSEILLFDLA